MFDEVLNWTSTEAKVWAIFTGRGSHSKTDMPGIWANATLRKQYTNMWRFIAKRYAYHDNMLGYEVMSELATATMLLCTHFTKKCVGLFGLRMPLPHVW